MPHCNNMCLHVFTATVLYQQYVGQTLFFCTFWKSGITQITKSCVSAKRVQPSTQTYVVFTHGAPQSADRMALYTPGYTGIKQGLLLQAPHRIRNTMEPRTSGLAVTSFLEGTLFLWCISFQTYRHWASMVSSAIGQKLPHQCLHRPVCGCVCVSVCTCVSFHSPTLRTKSL